MHFQMDPEIKVLVTGSRYWDIDTGPYLDYIIKQYPDSNFVLFHGACQGIDLNTASAAKKRGWRVVSFPADWKKYGKAAGPIRNEEMINQNPDLVLAFLAKNSKGTLNCLKQMTKSSSIKFCILITETEAVVLNQKQLAENFK